MIFRRYISSANSETGDVIFLSPENPDDHNPVPVRLRENENRLIKVSSSMRKTFFIVPYFLIC
jgi:hypothetical protein